MFNFNRHTYVALGSILVMNCFLVSQPPALENRTGSSLSTADQQIQRLRALETQVLTEFSRSRNVQSPQKMQEIVNRQKAEIATLQDQLNHQKQKKTILTAIFSLYFGITSTVILLWK